MSELLNKGVEDGTYIRVIPNDKINTPRLIAKIKQISNNAKRTYDKLRANVNLYIKGGSRMATPKDLVMHHRPRITGQPHTELSYKYRIKNFFIDTPGHLTHGLATIENEQLPVEFYNMARMRITIKTHKGDHYPVRPIIAATNPIGKIMESYIHKLLKLFITPINTHKHQLKTHNTPKSQRSHQLSNNKFTHHQKLQHCIRNNQQFSHPPEPPDLHFGPCQYVYKCGSHTNNRHHQTKI